MFLLAFQGFYCNFDSFLVVLHVLVFLGSSNEVWSKFEHFWNDFGRKEELRESNSWLKLALKISQVLLDELDVPWKYPNGRMKSYT